MHLGGEGLLGLIHGVTSVESLDSVRVLVPCLADAKMLRIGLGVGQTWTGSGELGDVAVYEFHL